MFIGKYNKSVIVTYIGACLSIIGIYLTLNENISDAIICLIFAGICDLFDGKIARMCKRDDVEKEFGKHIDSLVDVISFIAFPAVIGMKLFSSLYAWTNIVILLYSLSGVIRLAWFNIVSSKEKEVKYFVGVPVAYIALILPIIYAVQLFFKINLDFIYPIIYGLFAFFFILNIKIPKPREIWYVFFSIVAIFVTIIVKMVG